jgi:rubrerythrin
MPQPLDAGASNEDNPRSGETTVSPSVSLVVECDACGEDIVYGEAPHECPVGGNTVTLELQTVASLP